MNGYKINNMPEYAKLYNYIVARIVDDELWFYGAYATEPVANFTASTINGIVIKNTEKEI